MCTLCLLLSQQGQKYRRLGATMSPVAQLDFSFNLCDSFGLKSICQILEPFFFFQFYLLGIPSFILPHGHRYIFWRQQQYGSCFLIQSVNFCLFIGGLRQCVILLLLWCALASSADAVLSNGSFVPVSSWCVQSSLQTCFPSSVFYKTQSAVKFLTFVLTVESFAFSFYYD